MKKFGIGIAIVGLLLVSVCATLWLTNRPEPLPPSSTSAQRLTPGPYAVSKKTLTLVDTSRPIPAVEGGHPGAEGRELVCNLWWPTDAEGSLPLLVYSHGFMSNRDEGTYIHEILASRGWVIIAPDFPKSTFTAPGGPDVRDVVNQPGDVSFLIDQVLGWTGDQKPFAGTIAPDRIATGGLSLGGMTTTLVTFHPRFRDPRIKVAVSIAGPTATFLPDFFLNADVPFLMIGGTIDAMVGYEANAAPVPGLVREGGLVTIDGASHTGFSGMADPMMSFMSNPDALGCAALTRNIELPEGDSPDFGLGTADEGIAPPDGFDPPCSHLPLPEALHPARQHWVTALATVAFLQSHLAEDASTREASRRFLEETLPREVPEVHFVKASRTVATAAR